MFKKILCPLDGSDHAERALAMAIDMAKNYRASLVLLHALLRQANTTALQRFAEVEGLASHVEPEIRRLQSTTDTLQVPPLPSFEEAAISPRALVEIGQHILDNAKLDAEAKDVREVEAILVDGDPAEQILRCAGESGADCIVMGSRGLSDIRGLFVGSVSHKVMSRAPCTCIVVK